VIMLNFLRTLWQGLRSPNPLIMLSGLILAVGAWSVIAQWYISGDYINLPKSTLLPATYVDRFIAHYDVLKYRESEREKAAIFLFGGSSARECLPDDDRLEDSIKEKYNSDFKVLSLGTGNQSLIQSLALIDMLPDGREEDVLLIGVNIHRFNIPKSVIYEDLDNSFGDDIVWDLLQPEASQLTRFAGSFKNVVSLSYNQLSRVYGELTGNGPLAKDYTRHRYTYDKRLSDEELGESFDTWLTELDTSFEEYFNLNSGYLDTLIKFAMDKGYKPVLLELPLNTVYAQNRIDKHLKLYGDYCQEVADKYKILYLKTGQEVEWERDHFHDLTHLVEPGREVFLDKLTADLVEVIKH